MIYYANPCTETVRDAMLRGEIGCITTPHQGNVHFSEDWDVIADNGCFSSRWEYRHWWGWLVDQPRSIRFAVCPDYFDPEGGEAHTETVARWRKHSHRIRAAGFSPAFVCQVGAKPDNLPEDADYLFLGGTTEWKLGVDAWEICRRWAGERWIHMGRVNSKRRLETARLMGCDSADGTYLTFGPDINLPKVLRWLNQLESTPVIPGFQAALNTC